MIPDQFADKQIEAYRQMTGEQRLKIALDLHALSCDVAREGIRERYPNASAEFVEAKLRERITTGYAIRDAQDVTS